MNRFPGEKPGSSGTIKKHWEDHPADAVPELPMHMMIHQATAPFAASPHSTNYCPDQLQQSLNYNEKKCMLADHRKTLYSFGMREKRDRWQNKLRPVETVKGADAIQSFYLKPTEQKHATPLQIFRKNLTIQYGSIQLCFHTMTMLRGKGSQPLTRKKWCAALSCHLGMGKKYADCIFDAAYREKCEYEHKEAPKCLDYPGSKDYENMTATLGDMAGDVIAKGGLIEQRRDMTSTVPARFPGEPEPGKNKKHGSDSSSSAEYPIDGATALRNAILAKAMEGQSSYAIDKDSAEWKTTALLRAFYAVDTNKSGDISGYELQYALESGMNIDWKSITGCETMNEVVKLFDKDASGSIDLGELLGISKAAVRKLIKKQPLDVNDTFDDFRRGANSDIEKRGKKPRPREAWPGKHCRGTTIASSAFFPEGEHVSTAANFYTFSREPTLRTDRRFEFADMCWFNGRTGPNIGPGSYKVMRCELPKWNESPTLPWRKEKFEGKNMFGETETEKAGICPDQYLEDADVDTFMPRASRADWVQHRANRSGASFNTSRRQVGVMGPSSAPRKRDHRKKVPMMGRLDFQPGRTF